MPRPTKSPAFQFYPADYLSDVNVATMTVEQEGAYIRLLAFCWLHGSIPIRDEAALRALVKGSQMDLSPVLRCFTKKGQHVRLDFERSKQKNWSEKSRLGGINSAVKRWAVRVATPPSNRPVTPKGNSSFSSSSSFSLSEIQESTVPAARGRARANGNGNGHFKPPTVAEVEEFVNQRGYRIDPAMFVSYYDSNGWKVGKNPMKNWKAAVAHWDSRREREG